MPTLFYRDGYKSRLYYLYFPVYSFWFLANVVHLSCHFVVHLNTGADIYEYAWYESLMFPVASVFQK